MLKINQPVASVPLSSQEDALTVFPSALAFSESSAEANYMAGRCAAAAIRKIQSETNGPFFGRTDRR